ncbi:transmembrane channel-like protein 7 isoform X2 [Argopecten irradians]|uniref:transmembrane channel-like protein 7 isoform X2 n=1 Tax=Argopecten irradians TaxID=31199 RepID=UPI00371C41B1
MESFGGYAKHAYRRQLISDANRPSTINSQRDPVQSERILTNMDITRRTTNVQTVDQKQNEMFPGTSGSLPHTQSTQNMGFSSALQTERNLIPGERQNTADANVRHHNESLHREVISERDDVQPFMRRASLAKTLSKSIVTGSLQAHHSRTQFNEDQYQKNTVEPSKLKEFMGTDSLMVDKTKKQQKKNVRANMNCLALLSHDFKVWYRRWKHKHWELPLLKKYIEKIESNFGSGLGSLFVFARWILCLNIGLSILWVGLVILPTAITFSYNKVKVDFSFKNLLDGRGAVGQSWLFFGKYQEKVGNEYWLSVAYLFLLLITYFGSLLLIMRSIGEASLPKSASPLQSQNKFSLLVFTSWDHSITNKEASRNMVHGIASIIKDNMYEVKASDAERNRSVKERRGIYCRRILAWFFTFLLVGGGCTLIVFLVIYNVSSLIKEQGDTGLSEDSMVVVYSTPIIFTLINFLVPLCIKQLPKMEDYHSGRKELYVTLARVFFLRMANLFCLLISLYTNINSHIEGGGCLGTVIGQEIYKLVVMDTIIHVIFSMFKFLPYYWTKKKSEFDLSAAVLVLVYRQGLVWVGTIACPLMPLAGAISCLVFFVTNYNLVRCVCRPPLKRWNQSRNTRFLMGFLLITLAAVILPMSVIIGSQDLIHLGQTASSRRFCGPFGRGRPTDAYRHYVAQLDSWPGKVLHWLGSDIVTIPLIFIIISLLSYQGKLLSGEKHYRVLLQAELQQEREDNQELIKKLQVVGIGM